MTDLSKNTEVIPTLAAAAEILSSEPSPKHAQQVVHAARFEWAKLYDTILTVGNVSPDRLRLFDETLKKCRRVLGTDASNEKYGSQIDWYQSLVDSYNKGGTEAVQQAEGDRFREMVRSI